MNVYRSLFENNPEAVYALDAAGRFTDANPACSKLFGYACDDLLHKPFTSFLANQTSERTHVELMEAAEAGRSSTGSIEITTKQGVIITVELTLYPLNEGGRFAGSWAIAKQRHVHSNTRYVQVKSEPPFYRDFLEHSYDIFTVYDVQFVRKFISRSAFIHLGHLPEYYIGKALFDHVYTDDRQVVLNKYCELLLLKLPTQMEYRMPHRDGRLLWFESRIVPLLAETGEVKEFIGVSRNITERKQALEAIRQTEEKYRLIAENTLDMIRLIDKDRKVIYASPSHEAVLGYAPSEIIGSIKCEHVHPDDFPITMEKLEALMQQKVPTTAELRYKHKQGHYVLLEIDGIPLMDDNSEVSGVILVARDITKRRKTEELLLESEKLSVIGELAAGIAHEIRNPLTSIKGFIQLLRSTTDHSGEYFDIILSELDRINFIVSELLVLSRPQVHEYKYKNLTEILENVLMLLDTQAILNNVRIYTNMRLTLFQVKCEENHLKQVFINLLKNAIEAMPNGGNIIIRTETVNQNSVRLSFIDNGCGIPEELLPRLGEPFYTTKEKGTGLGLMVSYKIIRDHGGTINISSKVNEGTTVEITLPCRL